MAPLDARTPSPYRIGIRVDLHRPACITDPKSMFNANKFCAAPTLTEWSLTWGTCFAGIPIHRATLICVGDDVRIESLPYPILAHQTPK